MRRWIAVFFLLILLAAPAEATMLGEAYGRVPSLPGGLAVSPAEAVTIARGLFPIPEAWGEPIIAWNEVEERGQYQLYWERGAAEGQESISVGIDSETGQVWEYVRWGRGEGRGETLTLSLAEALRSGAVWLERLLPEAVRSELHPVAAARPLDSAGGLLVYPIRWQRMAHGYPVRDEYAEVLISAATGELRSFLRTWRSGSQFTLPDRMLSQVEAERLFRGAVTPTLQYQATYLSALFTPQYHLLYQTGGDRYLDPSGLLLDAAGHPVSDSALSRRLVEPSESPYLRPAEPLGLAEAERLARAATGEKEPATERVVGANGAFRFTWTWEEGGSLTVGIDPAAGLITDLGRYEPTVPGAGGVRLPLKRLEDEAVRFLRTFRPDLSGRLMRITPPVDSGPSVVHFVFSPLYQGVPFADTGVMVSLNPYSGRVVGLWTGSGGAVPAGLPDPGNALSPEQAMDALLAFRPLRPVWIHFFLPERATTVPRLVWALDPEREILGIDGLTGQPVGYDGRNALESSRLPTDLAGSAYEPELLLLWAEGIVESEAGQIRPEAQVTVGEALRWLVLVQPQSLVSPQADDYQALRDAPSPYLAAALARGLAEPDEVGDLTATVSRERFALWAIRAMGYGRIAEMGIEILPPYADAAKIDPAYRNAVALLTGFGAVGGADRFEPDRAITRGEAARILASVLRERR